MKRIDHNDLIPWFIQDHDTLPKAYLESCQKFFLELDRRASSRKRQATSLPQSGNTATGKQKGKI
tara:strand:+ start:329 stop:523 length:195 start_codon:yes stop_codon:yes gene_type:complete